MTTDPQPAPDKKFPPADTGNASNPSPHEGTAPPDKQLLGAQAEKYLREAANIEDVPDAQDQEDMDETIAEETEEKSQP